MTIFDTFPDVEAAVGWYLRNAGVASGRVYSSIPSSPTFPLVTYERIGGVPAERHRLDRARIQFMIWGNSKSEARDLTELVRVTVNDMEGRTLTVAGGAPVDAVITGVELDLGVTWSPDPPTDRDRYLFGMAIYIHAYP